MLHIIALRFPILQLIDGFVARYPKWKGIEDWILNIMSCGNQVFKLKQTFCSAR